MAVAFTKQPDTVRPVYSPIVFAASDSANNIISYNVEITVGATTLTNRYTPDETNAVEFDVSFDLSGLFESEVFFHTSANDIYGDGLKSYTVKVTANHSSGSTSVTSSTRYIFNGTEQVSTPFVFSDYQLTNNGNKSILSKWQGERFIHTGDRFLFQFFEGSFGGATSRAGNILVDIYNGSTLITTSTIYSDSSYTSTPKIRSISFLLSSEATHRVVRSSTNAFDSFVLRTIPIDSRFDRYFRFAYVNSLGSIDFINADLTNANDITIDREGYRNRRSDFTVRQNSLNTEIEDRYTAMTDVIPESISLNLKELWYSPKVAVIESDTSVRTVILNNTTRNIFNRRNNRLITYEISFNYEEEFVIQKQ